MPACFYFSLSGSETHTKLEKCKDNYLDYMSPKNSQIFGRAGKEEVAGEGTSDRRRNMGEKCSS